MQEQRIQSVNASLRSVVVASVGCAVMAMLLSSCTTDLATRHQERDTSEVAPAAPYLIVCVIHGDGNYVYHDTRGNEYLADEEALAVAKRMARRNPRAEVFIFHQRPSKRFLFFFPLHNGEFYHYRNGRLIANELYWRDQDQSRFAPEVDLYRRSRSNKGGEQMSVFLYCGHEIPESGGAGYDASFPDRSFTVHDLADALEAFAPRAARFDLLALSTCFGGTPYTVGALAPFTRHIVASPENLHLSYFNLGSLERLDLTLRDGDVSAFARRFASQSFDKLTDDVQTTVSVAVYNTDHVQEYLQSTQSVYRRTLSELMGNGGASPVGLEHCDCADLPAFALPAMHEGVGVLYRPALFGRAKRKQNHSGWECWTKRGAHAVVSPAIETVLSGSIR